LEGCCGFRITGSSLVDVLHKHLPAALAGDRRGKRSFKQHGGRATATLTTNALATGERSAFCLASRLRASSMQTSATFLSSVSSEKACEPYRSARHFHRPSRHGVSREPKDTYKLSNLGDLVRCACAACREGSRGSSLLWGRATVLRISDRGCTAHPATLQRYPLWPSVAQLTSYMHNREPFMLSAQKRREEGQTNEGTSHARSRAFCDLRYR
jgi:hypothetical protein